jgi:hypothetical protein
MAWIKDGEMVVGTHGFGWWDDGCWYFAPFPKPITEIENQRQAVNDFVDFETATIFKYGEKNSKDIRRLANGERK